MEYINRVYRAEILCVDISSLIYDTLMHCIMTRAQIEGYVSLLLALFDIRAFSSLCVNVCVFLDGDLQMYEFAENADLSQ